MKKLLLLALIPSLTFAYQVQMESVPQAFGGSVNQVVDVGGHYNVAFKNSTHKKCTYRYTIKLCPQGNNCKVHETEYHLDPGEERIRSHQLVDKVKYNLPGRYELTAIQELHGCGIDSMDKQIGYLYIFS